MWIHSNKLTGPSPGITIHFLLLTALQGTNKANGNHHIYSPKLIHSNTAGAAFKTPPTSHKMRELGMRKAKTSIPFSQIRRGLLQALTNLGPSWPRALLATSLFLWAALRAGWTLKSPSSGAPLRCSKLSTEPGLQ